MSKRAIGFHTLIYYNRLKSKEANNLLTAFERYESTTGNIRLSTTKRTQ